MNQITVNAELHFHEQELISIFHETNVANKEEQFAELVFAAAFAIRSISNLGPSPTTDALGQYLKLLRQIIFECPGEILTPKPKIVAYPGYVGRKQFIAQLRFSNSQMQLDYAAKGFGWFATGVGYYCPASVQSMFRYFAHRRCADGSYLSALANVAAACGQLQSANQIQLTNHPQLVMMLIVACMEEFMPEWLTEA